LVGYTFLRKNTAAYVSRAFDLGRVFLFKWTVNWRFVPEDIFVSKPFAITLLATHVSLLALFAFTRWTKPANLSLLRTVKYFGLTSENQVPLGLLQDTAGAVTPRFILTTIMTSMAAGLLCARTLHYQFYAYVAWVVPILLWQSRLHPIFIYALWGAQEWAWNVFPSTDASSAVVVSVLAISVVGSWLGTSGPKVDDRRAKEIDEAVKAYGTKPAEPSK
jgi:alpha-1,3-mannosyltransferase